MGAPQWMLMAMSFLCLTGVNACSPADPVTARDIEHYTGVEFCRSAAVHDLTIDEERSTTPGFSFHVTVDLTPACAASFERQLARLAPVECAQERIRRAGCFVEDVYPAAAKHTSIMVQPLANDRFDLRFFA